MHFGIVTICEPTKRRTRKPTKFMNAHFAMQNLPENPNWINTWKSNIRPKPQHLSTAYSMGFSLIDTPLQKNIITIFDNFYNICYYYWLNIKGWWKCMVAFFPKIKTHFSFISKIFKPNICTILIDSAIILSVWNGRQMFRLSALSRVLIWRSSLIILDMNDWSTRVRFIFDIKIPTKAHIFSRACDDFYLYRNKMAKYSEFCLIFYSYSNRCLSALFKKHLV